MKVQVNVVYVVNGTTKVDVLVGTDPSIQQQGNRVGINFPHGDGTYVQEFFRAPEPKGHGLSWVGYGHGEKVEKLILEMDTHTEPS